MKLARRLYEAAPLLIQALILNAEGIRTYQRKYGQRFRAALDRFEDHELLSPPDLKSRQDDAVRDLLRYAREHVPYYRRLARSTESLADWPVLEKRTVATSTEEFLSDEWKRGGLITQKTSGTTGTPLTVHITPEAYQLEMAFRWRHRAWAGVPFITRGAYLAGHPVVPPAQRKPPFWRHDRVEDRLLFSSYHMSEATLPHYLKALRHFEPGFIHGYPSSIFLLASFALVTGVEIRPRAVFTASETLLDFQRERIAQAFGAKVYNWYGQTELTCNIVECVEGNLHARMDYGVLEVAEDGSLITTGFNNRGMPLIRYRSGDRVTMGHGSCPCGCSFPLVERIEGRVEEYVVTGDGRFVGRLDHLFKGAEGVVEAQVVQREPGAVVLRVVRGEAYTPGVERKIREEAFLRLGASTAVSFDYVDVIGRTGAGKFRFVLNELAGQGAPEWLRGNARARAASTERTTVT